MTGPEFENKNLRRGTEGTGDEFVPVISKPGSDRAQMIGRVLRRGELSEPQLADLIDISGIPEILQLDTSVIERKLEILADHGVEPYTIINGSAPQPPEIHEADTPTTAAPAENDKVRFDLDLSPTNSPTLYDQMSGRTFRPEPLIVNTAPSESSDQPPLITTAGIPGGDEFRGMIIDESHHADSPEYEIVDPTRPPEGYITTDEMATRLLGDNHLRNLRRNLRDMIDLTQGYDAHAQVIDPIEPVGEIAPQPPQPEEGAK